MKYRETAVIMEQREIAQGIYSLWLHADDIVKEARPGQFVSVYCQDESRLLPRPISICELDKESGRLRLVYRDFPWIKAMRKSFLWEGASEYLPW